MIEPNLISIAQKGFAKTSSVLLSKTFGGPWWDLDSALMPDSALPQGRPIFFYSTHSSWWDPMVFALIAIEIFKSRTISPMDEREFRKYKSLRFAGVFGVSEGEGQLVESVIEREFEKFPQTRVWVTPQGAFAPNELKQPDFKTGLSRWSLPMRGIRIPVSIHYYFGPEAKPGLFVRVGKAESPPESLVLALSKAQTPQEKNLVFKADSDGLKNKLDEQGEEFLKKIYIANKGKFVADGKFLKIERSLL